MDVFLTIPTTGDAICTFGTAIDPTDEVWARVSDIVCSIIRKAIGLDRAQCRELACATTADLSDQLTSRVRPIPIPTSIPSLAAGGEVQ
jgi:hypothetical protein